MGLQSSWNDILMTLVHSKLGGCVLLFNINQIKWGWCSMFRVSVANCQIRFLLIIIYRESKKLTSVSYASNLNFWEAKCIFDYFVS